MTELDYPAVSVELMFGNAPSDLSTQHIQEGSARMFIEFDTASGAIVLNVRHIVLVKRSSNDGAEIILTNGGSATVTVPDQEVFRGAWCARRRSREQPNSLNDVVRHVDT